MSALLELALWAIDWIMPPVADESRAINRWRKRVGTVLILTFVIAVATAADLLTNYPRTSQLSSLVDSRISTSLDSLRGDVQRDGSLIQNLTQTTDALLLDSLRRQINEAARAQCRAVTQHNQGEVDRDQMTIDDLQDEYTRMHASAYQVVPCAELQP